MMASWQGNSFGTFVMCLRVSVARLPHYTKAASKISTNFAARAAGLRRQLLASSKFINGFAAVRPGCAATE
jgi:hypothetical protein